MQKLVYKGKDYYFGDLTVDHIDLFSDWAKDRIPHPVNQVLPILGNLTPDQAKMVLDAATREAARVISSMDERVGSMHATPDGRVKLLSLVLRDRHTDLTEKEAHDLVSEMAKEHRDECFMIWKRMNDDAKKKYDLPNKARESN